MHKISNLSNEEKTKKVLKLIELFGGTEEDDEGRFGIFKLLGVYNYWDAMELLRLSVVWSAMMKYRFIKTRAATYLGYNRNSFAHLLEGLGIDVERLKHRFSIRGQREERQAKTYNHRQQ